MSLAFLFLFPLSLAQAAEAGCKAVNFQQARPCVETVEGCFVSAATGSRVQYSVTFPANYQPGQKLPYAIFLHGRGSDQGQFVWAGGAQALNEYGKAGGAPFLVVAPTEPKHSYWKNGPLNEFGTATMVNDELIAHLEASGGVAKSPQQRGIMGISMGGHGALYLASLRPDLYGAVYSMSPVFRAENELDESDKPAFGAGPSYRKQSPVALHKAREEAGSGGFPFENFYVEIGRDDSFLKKGSGTKRFFEHLKSGGDAAKISDQRPGGHDLEYWTGSLRRAIRFMGDSFRRESAPQVPCPTGGPREDLPIRELAKVFASPEMQDVRCN